ncbi:MAG: hypothetical protein RRY79_03280 [Clostridia bacterium]
MTDYINRRKSQGWSEVETEYLFDEVKKARDNGSPLLSVFESVARNTGRKPNSVRNFYYLKIRDDETKSEFKKKGAAFVPFSKEESKFLIETVLKNQAKGISVRACTLSMGESDNRAMLRYQNKYRSLIKNDKQFVLKIIEEVRENGEEIFDPYMDKRKSKSGRPKKPDESNLVEIVSKMVDELCKVESLDVSALLKNLGVLAVSANRGAELIKRRNTEANDFENAEKMRALEMELNELKIRYSSVCSSMRRLLSVNRDFLSMSGVSKVSSLSLYLRDLSKSVTDCDRLSV